MLKVFVDLDGTIAGYSKWVDLFQNTVSIFRTEIYFNPDLYFDEWSILTGRPRVDIPIIKLFCSFRKLNPSSIITCKQFIWTKKCILKKAEFLNSLSKEFHFLYIDSDENILELYQQKFRFPSGQLVTPEQFLRSRTNSLRIGVDNVKN